MDDKRGVCPVCNGTGRELLIGAKGLARTEDCKRCGATGFIEDHLVSLSRFREKLRADLDGDELGGWVKENSPSLLAAIQAALDRGSEAAPVADASKRQPSTQWKFWREARPMALEPYYCYWVSHLTSEGLHDKADIATVLAILHQQRDDMQDDALRLHREKMDALFGPDGKPRASSAAPRWIPLSERKPAYGLDVLVTDHGVGGEASINMGRLQQGQPPYRDTWTLRQEPWEGTGPRYERVTHWLPLPEPALTGADVQREGRPAAAARASYVQPNDQEKK